MAHDLRSRADPGWGSGGGGSEGSGAVKGVLTTAFTETKLIKQRYMIIHIYSSDAPKQFMSWKDFNIIFCHLHLSFAAGG